MNPEHCDPSEDPVERFLFAKFGPADSASGGCPEPGQLAGFAEGRLTPEERLAVEEHVAECGACRALVAVVSDASAAVLPSRRARVRPWHVAAGVAAAALLLVAFSGGGSEPVDTDQMLVAVAGDLLEARPDLFEEFHPLSRDERLAPGPARRGGLASLYPAGVLVETRPRTRWEKAAGVNEYEIAYYSGDGELVWRTAATGTTLDYPADQPELEPGQQYFWEVSYRSGPFGGDESQRRFSLATKERRATFEAALREIESRAPRKVSKLLQAHLAIQERFFGEAERAARAFVEENPNDRVGRETLFQVLEQLGSSDSADVLED